MNINPHHLRVIHWDDLDIDSEEIDFVDKHTSWGDAEFTLVSVSGLCKELASKSDDAERGAHYRKVFAALSPFDGGGYYIALPG